MLIKFIAIKAKSYKIGIVTTILCIIQLSYSQQSLLHNNPYFSPDIIELKKNYFSYFQTFYLNTNLPNLENKNGFYFPKGYGAISGFSYKYQNDIFFISLNPNIINQRVYNVQLPNKNFSFSVLNDVPKKSYYSGLRLVNSGVKIKIPAFYLGFGNWNHWWGPGIHNSLVLSNNSEGFKHILIENPYYVNITKNLKYKLKYIVSERIQNKLHNSFYFTGLFINLKIKNIELGFSKNILSGGYDNIDWGGVDPYFVPITNKKIKYWDYIQDYYILAHFPNSKLDIFIEFGFPNRVINNTNNNEYSEHALGSNLGIRKNSAFGIDNILFGLEYTRLVQSIYYNILPSPNWYDNALYNYSSYKNRRWAAHSGSDSDDLLVYLGYKGENKSAIYGLNYERHGVNYNFPPEIKLESRFIFSIKNQNNTIITINYEYEYFKHYGFVDSNENVWAEDFESGSIQNSKTLLFVIEKVLY